MARRHYTSNARETTLTSSVDASAVTIAVDAPVGYPSETPFIVHCELGTSSEEILLVTAVVGSSWTVTRGYDGSTAVAHDLGAKIVHGVSAIDMDEANAHVNATTGIHGLGVGAALVGTTTTQTLTNKTLSGPSVNDPTLVGGSWDSPFLTGPTVDTFVGMQHDHSDAANGGELSGGSGSGGFYFSKNSSTGGGGEDYLSSSYTDITSTSITFTAPAVWPTGATGIAWHLHANIFSASTSSVYYMRQLLDGVQNTFHGEMQWSPRNTMSTPYDFMVFTALPTVGVSHTSKWQIKVPGAAPANIHERLVWAYLI